MYCLLSKYLDNALILLDFKKSLFFRLVILPLVDHQQYTKDELINSFGCTKYQIDTARKWRSSTDSLHISQSQIFKRNKLDKSKSEHFIEFIFNSGLLQDVAYGTAKIKFDDGIVHKVANAVLTTKYNHTIALYKMNCKSIGYIPLSESSLWRILKAVKPSRKKCLGEFKILHFM